MNSRISRAPFSGALARLPKGCRLHAPSWDECHAAVLAQEVAIHRLHISPAKGQIPWPPGGPVWARERFGCSSIASGMVAYSTDEHGRIIRGWFTNPTDQASYLVGGFGMPGPLTCPIEAVWLELLAPGLPGFPGHLFIGAERQWPGCCDVADDLREIWGIEIHPGKGDRVRDCRTKVPQISPA